jgi:hypothetical protein
MAISMIQIQEDEIESRVDNNVNISAKIVAVLLLLQRDSHVNLKTFYLYD